MGAKEMAAAAAIESKAKEVVKLVKKYRFHELAPHVAQLKALIEKANKLPDANPYIDPDEIEYPFERQSAYLVCSGLDQRSYQKWAASTLLAQKAG